MDKEQNQAISGNGSDNFAISGISKIIAIAEANGWSVSTDEMRSGNIDFEFSKYTPAGQDFNFSAELTDDDAKTLIENIKSYYERFDVDEEASAWIGEDGHGKKGAPYHIKDIVRDMEAAEEMVYQLYNALNQAFV